MPPVPPPSRRFEIRIDNRHKEMEEPAFLNFPFRSLDRRIFSVSGAQWMSPPIYPPFAFPPAAGRKRKETRNICRPALKAVCLCPLPDYCGSGPEDLYSKPASFQNGWGGKDLSPAAAHKRERKVFFLKKTYFNLFSLCTSSSPPEREGESKDPLPGTKLQGIKSPPPFPLLRPLSLSSAYHKDGGEKRHYLLTRNRRLRPPQQLSLSLLIPPLLLPLLPLPQNFKRSFLSSAKAPPPTLTKRT